ncbi:hypothetical protein GGR10_000369 [Bartonella chomelii]|uniref:Uncharacterized protein n=1 Tax=Bartonella chomelii TaxID=236402 RepID=A0ABR6E344_9HYPH|nr:hypothetical protein [Bartonella chomelii]
MSKLCTEEKEIKVNRCEIILSDFKEKRQLVLK